MRYITKTAYRLQPTVVAEPIPENFYDFVQLMTKRGLKFTFERFWKDDEELIMCKRTEDDTPGYYSAREEKFYTLEEILKDMHKDYDWESLMKKYDYNNDVPYFKIDYISGN